MGQSSAVKWDIKCLVVDLFRLENIYRFVSKLAAASKNNFVLADFTFAFVEAKKSLQENYL